MDGLQEFSEVPVVFFELYSPSWGGNKGTALIHQQRPTRVHLHKATSRNELGFPPVRHPAEFQIDNVSSQNWIKCKRADQGRGRRGPCTTDSSVSTLCCFIVEALSNQRTSNSSLIWFHHCWEWWWLSPKSIKLCESPGENMPDSETWLITPEVFSIYDTSLASFLKKQLAKGVSRVIQ